ELDEPFWVDCLDCYGGQIRSERDLRPEIDISAMDASTGPIAVNGVKASDTIKIRIYDILLANQGVMVTAPGLGPLGDLIEKADTKIIPIRNGEAIFSDAIKLPLRPMLGVLGVAPAEGKVHCAIPGDHGGNMDTKEIRSGNSVYLPVFIDGANLALGDIHACMGDGELSGTGIEIAGQVLLSVSKVPGLSLELPVVETPDSFMFIASAKTFNTCARRAIKITVDFIAASRKLSMPDAYRLLSASCDLRVSQIVNEKITLRTVVPKTIMAALPSHK
ncbi:MAG: acetamidase/formamidase family protein, partial [Acetomicrobium sp.]